MPLKEKRKLKIKGKRKRTKKTKGKKLKVEPNICDDAHFDKNLSIVYIDYSLECPVFKSEAQKLYRRLCEKLPENNFKLIENEPKQGLFEVRLARNCRLPCKTIWNGTDKEPREFKFPNDDQDFSSIMNKVKEMFEK